MPKIAVCKADVVYTGPCANELQAFAAPGSWTKERSDSFAAVLEGLTKAGYRSTFPNDDAIIRLVGAILLEQNDERAVQRSRYMTLETIGQISDDPRVSLPAVAR